jgi:hypothetical protein
MFWIVPTCEIVCMHNLGIQGLRKQLGKRRLSRATMTIDGYKFRISGLG